MNNDPQPQAGFIEDFEYEDNYYLAHIKHYTAVTEDELFNNHVCDGEFFVRLLSFSGCVSFKVYLNDDLTWRSNSSTILVDQRMVDVIGIVIDMKLFYS